MGHPSLTGSYKVAALQRSLDGGILRENDANGFLMSTGRSVLPRLVPPPSPYMQSSSLTSGLTRGLGFGLGLAIDGDVTTGGVVID